MKEGERGGNLSCANASTKKKKNLKKINGEKRNRLKKGKMEKRAS